MPTNDLVAALRGAPAQSVAEVIAVMNAIEASLPLPDGIGYFNKLYKTVTERVAVCIADGTFTAPEYVEQLDVVFANLYFAALKTFITDRDQTPRAWYPLFSHTGSKGIAPIQFALAGMNAHINRDLPVAVVTVSEQHQALPARDSREKGDYDRLNPILQEVETSVRAWFLEGFIKEFDGLFEKADTMVANFSLVEARAAAWSHAEALWQLRHLAPVREAYLDGLDGLVGFAGRGLLIAVSI